MKKRLTDNKQIGESIKKLRESMGLKQPKFAKMLGYKSGVEVSKTENGHALSINFLVMLKKVFGVSIDALLADSLVKNGLDFAPTMRGESFSAYSHKVNLYRADALEEYFKEIPVGGITQERIEAFRAERLKKVTATTVNQDLKILRKYLDIAVNKEWIKDNPSRKLKLMREPKARIPRCLYPEELKVLFRNMRKFRHLLYGEFPFIVRVLVYSGLRRSELCGLKPDQVKLNLRQLHIMGKGQKTRIVGIHKSLLKDFQARVRRGYILRSVRPESISRAFKTVLRSLGLPEALTLHSLRHTYISYLLEHGIPPKRVQEKAGHFSLNITARYSHALPSKTVDEDVLDFEGRSSIAKV